MGGSAYYQRGGDKLLPKEEGWAKLTYSRGHHRTLAHEAQEPIVLYTILAYYSQEQLEKFAQKSKRPGPWNAPTNRFKIRTNERTFEGARITKDTIKEVKDELSGI